MRALKQYELAERVAQRRGVTTYRAAARGSRRNVVIDIVSRDRAGVADAVSRGRHAYDVARQISHPAVLQVLDFHATPDAALLVHEDFGGAMLEQLIPPEGLPVSVFLPLASQLAEALAAVHERGFIHAAISPRSVFANLPRETAKLGGFGSAFRFHRDSPVRWRESSRYTQAYEAPERSGRLTRVVDYRADLYALGATFYHMLSGAVPFGGQDALAVTHGHIAQAHVPLDERRADVPAVLARIVDKLLAKDPADRYQSAHGLAHDLARCRERSADLQDLEPFELAEADLPARIELPDRLYGRDSELAQLRASFERVCQGGARIAYVCGEAGSGKSALARSLAREVARAGGIFLAGKVEQGRSDEPYAALSGALTEWVHQLLTEPADVLRDYRQKIGEALGANQAILAAVLPALEQIVSPPEPSQKPAIAAIGGFSTSTRLHVAFAKLLALICRPDRPIVLFLDDLQWASSALTQLIEGAWSSAPLPHLLLICGYRGDEIGPQHPVSHMRKALQRAGIASDRIELGALSESSIAELLADTLRAERWTTTELAQLVAQKSRANPFALRTLLLELEALGDLKPCPSLGRWTWDVDAIRALPDNGDAWCALSARLERLPAPTREALWVASRVSSQISVPMLAALLAEPPDETWQRLLPALRDDLIVLPDAELAPPEPKSTAPYGGKLRFSHDKVQQACGALSVPWDVRVIHGRIGRFLLETAPHDQQDAHIFSIVDHMNRALSPDANARDRRQLAELNLLAGRRARAMAAYVEGLIYFERALELLELPSAWYGAHDLAFELHLGLAECAAVLEQTGRARETLEQMRQHAHNAGERFALLRARVAFESSVSAFDVVLTLLRDALAEYGVELPTLEQLALESAQDWAETEQLLHTRSVDELVGWRETRSERARVVLDLLAEAIPAAYFVSKPLMNWVVLKSLQFMLDQGFTRTAGYSFAAYAMQLVVRFAPHERVQRLEQIALRLAERFHGSHRGRIDYIRAIFLAHWTQPPDRSLGLLRAAQAHSLEDGDLFHARLAALMLPLMLVQTGHNVDAVIEANQQLTALRAYGRNAMFTAFARSLQGVGTDPTRLDLAKMKEEAFHAAVDARGATSSAYFLLFKLELLVLHGRWADAVQLVQRWDRLILGEVGAAGLGIEYVWLSALAVIARLRELREPKHEELVALLAQRREWLATWAALNPHNFSAKHCLVEAEWSALDGAPTRAAELYDAAIAASTRSGMTHELALANERAGGFYLRRDRRTLALGYLEEAREAYLRWGAVAKARELGPALQLRHKAPRDDDFDLLSVIKASQVLASETRLQGLVQRVVQICCENAGADRALLVWNRSGELRVAAGTPTTESDAEVGVPLTAEHEVSVGIVRYVLRTGESIVLDDAAGAGTFTEDPTVRAVAARSILAMPLSKTNPGVGVLYLENRLTRSAFVRERLPLLEMLVRQARILIDNAEFLQRTQRLNAALEAENLQRQHAEAQLRASERRMIGFLDGLPVGVVIVDAERNVHFVNRTARAILREQLASSEAKHAPTLFRPGAAQPIDADAVPSRRALHGEYVWDDDVEVRHADGSVPLTVWATPFHDPTGRVEFAIVAFQDVTHAKRAAAERSLLEDRVRQAQNMESIGRLAAGVAHDLNNMLVPIQGFAGLAASAERHEDVVEYLRPVLQAAEQAAELTRSLLAVARQQVLTMIPLHLSREIGAMERILNSVVREDITFVRDLAEELPSVQADRPQLRQVMMNLVANACDAMPRGGTLELSTRRVTLQAPLTGTGSKEIPPGDYVVMAVSDTGAGMTDETLARVFEPFYTTKQLGKGIGLGLAIVFGIVEQHRGYIHVHSALDHGTTFEVWLPSVSALATVDDAGLDRPIVKRSERLVLVVEDDDGVRSFLESSLRESGYTLLMARSPSEALALMQEAVRVPDAVVSDVVLPEMNGRELLSLLRAQHPELRCLFISGYAANILSESDGLPAGTRFLAKPFSLPKFLRTLDELIAIDAA